MNNPTRMLLSCRFALLAGILLLVAGFACIFLVSETEYGIVVRFGKPVRQMREPGFYFRLPSPVEKIIRVDRRLQHADIRLSETLTQDRRNVIVPAFFTWKVAEPLQYHVSVGSVDTANSKLDALVTSSRNSVLGRHDFADLVADQPDGALNHLEGEMLALVKEDARRQFGIELLSIGITRILLPEANTQSVFLRMRAERKREAAQVRAEGRAQATEMNAETDKQTAHLLAEANREAEELRGKAEAEAAAVYANAHGSDPDFYRFLRELQSLRSVVDRNTTLVLDTGMGPFHWLKTAPADNNPPLLQPLPSAPPVQPLPQTVISPALR